MRRSLRGVVLGVCAVAIALAAVLGYVGRGDAAGTNICPGSVCLTGVVSPHVTSATPQSGFAAFAAGRFNNNSPSTATHLNLTISFKDGTGAPASVSVGTIGKFVDASSVAPACTPVVSSVSSVSCSFPNLAGSGHVAKLQFPFTPVAPTPLTDGSTVTATLSATYGEGNGGANDSQTAVPDTLKISGAGKCTTGGSKLDPISNSSQTSSIGVLDYPPATDAQHLPCTAVGIDTSDTSVIDPNGIVGYPVTLELPLVAGFATVQHDVTPLPAKTTVKGLVIWESLEAVGDTSFTLKVPPCNADGLPKIPADAGFSSDTCVFSRSSLPKGGGRFIMHALGASIDPRYTP
jgi:hypothetical protein